MATPDKSLFKEKTQREKDQEMISGIAAKAAMDAGISKNARARLDTSSPAIKDAIKRRNLAQKQLDERNAKKDAKKNTVDYSEATKPKDKSAKKFNVGVSQGGVPFKTAFRHFKDKGNKTFTWNGTKYSTVTKDENAKKEKKTASGSGTNTDAPAKKTFRQRRAANLKAKIADENVGEGRKRRLKRRLGRVERRMAQGKAGGGMMKSKMSSKGGKMGGKMVRGYKDGDEVKKTENKKVRYVLKERKDKDKPGSRQGGKPVPKDNKGLAKLPKNVRNKMGYMKGGGMAKKGYSKGGAVKKKSKPRGVGVALRGYGRALK
jgi:hypothetical protein